MLADALHFAKTEFKPAAIDRHRDAHRRLLGRARHLGRRRCSRNHERLADRVRRAGERGRRALLAAPALGRAPRAHAQPGRGRAADGRAATAAPSPPAAFLWHFAGRRRALGPPRHRARPPTPSGPRAHPAARARRASACAPWSSSCGDGATAPLGALTAARCAGPEFAYLRAASNSGTKEKPRDPAARFVPRRRLALVRSPALAAQRRATRPPGKTNFDTLCATCHGPAGKGDGPAGAALNPPPRDFTEGRVQVRRRQGRQGRRRRRPRN